LLSPNAANIFSRLVDPLQLLKNYVSEFVDLKEDALDKQTFLNYILRYLYNCFNSTKSNLLTLLQRNTAAPGEIYRLSNDMTNEEISLINEFLLWDNDGKNALLFNIIVTSVEYCMLTTKQDTILSKKIFQGKRFFWDTNIIFRMAGVDKEERKFVTDSFIKKCYEVGIELCYTTETFYEIQQTLKWHTQQIQIFTQGNAPVNSSHINKLNPRGEISTFYEIYYKWTKMPSNSYSDFESFYKYLFRTIMETLSGIRMVSTDALQHLWSSENQRYTTLCESLRNYKNQKRPLRTPYFKSVQIDVKNVLYTLSQRNRNQATSLWNVNDFIVSADQLLIGWAEYEFT